MARYDDDNDDVRSATLDDLLGPVPQSQSPVDEYDPNATQNLFNAMSANVSDKNPSKSRRVREYLEAQPEARNRDVVEALAEYGVTAADVSNAKAQIKRQGEAPAKRGRPAGSSAAASAAPTANAVKTVASASSSPSGSIAMNEIDAALKFVREIGSMDRAKQLLQILQEIRQI